MSKIIQFTQLGKFGRFGNQIFQYIFARTYAERNNAVLEIPNWVGQKVFKNVNHPIPSVKLPRLSLDEFPQNGQVNIDLFGYCQKKKFLDYLSETKVREWLQFQDKWKEYFINSRTIGVAHIRRGDYLTKYSHRFCIISRKSYFDAFAKFGVSEKFIVWKSEEEQLKQRGTPIDLGFLPDFFEMAHTQHLFRANSTFSLWAGFLNATGKVYSPLIEGRSGECDVEFVEGNWPSLASGNPDFVFGK